MKKVLFIDRDGTLINEPAEDPQIDSLDKLKFIPGVITWLGKIARETDYELAMVSNQDGLRTASFPEETFWPVQHMIINTLAGEGIHFEGIHIDPTLPHENKPTRKPGIGMLGNFQSGHPCRSSTGCRILWPVPAPSTVRSARPGGAAPHWWVSLTVRC